MAFKFIFEPTPFWNSEWENVLPTLEEIKVHFHEMLELYKKYEHSLDEQYSNTMNNALVSSGQPGEYKDFDRAAYEAEAKEFHKLKLYYQHLLNAVRLKYNFWLNDLLPNNQKQKRSKK